MSEVWRPVVDFEGLYEVSNYGHVRRSGGGKGARRGLVLVNRQDDRGYAKCFLYRGDGKPHGLRVHCLVARAFLGPTPPGLEINHIDSNKMQPRLDNLEFVTHGQNIRHAIVAGCLPIRYGEAHPHARFSDADVGEMRRRCEAGESRSSVARSFATAPTVVSRIVLGQSR